MANIARDAERLITLERLFDAFNRHDAGGVMQCFAPDAVFLAAAGNEACGRTIAGTDAIRDAFVAVWTSLPDVRWTVRRSRILGGEAITEWLFTGSRADGSRVEAEGLDLFAFDGDLISSKSAFRKDRPPITANAAAA